ncbi:MAG: ATP-binding cassette family protein, partial [Microcystaceae cyanobacterium]
CEQHLDGHYHQQVMEKTQDQQKELQDQIWLIKEQIAVSGRELHILRTEYAHIQESLSGYDALQQHYGQLEAELERAGEVYEQKSVLQLEIQQLEDQLRQGDYAQELQQELLEIAQELQTLNYDEQRHSLARGAVEQYRWAEIQNAKLEDAQRQLNKITKEKPYLVQQIADYEKTLQNLHQTSDIYQQLQGVKDQLQTLGYERSQHQALLAQLR